jgi:hypothetical protein
MPMTWSVRSRKTASIGKRMKNVWIEEAGRRSRPSPTPRLAPSEQALHAPQRVVRDLATLADDPAAVLALDAH